MVELSRTRGPSSPTRPCPAAGIGDRVRAIVASEDGWVAHQRPRGVGAAGFVVFSAMYPVKIVRPASPLRSSRASAFSAPASSCARCQTVAIPRQRCGARRWSTRSPAVSRWRQEWVYAGKRRRLPGGVSTTRATAPARSNRRRYGGNESLKPSDTLVTTGCRRTGCGWLIPLRRPAVDITTGP
jgi:hypothetical protein